MTNPIKVALELTEIEDTEEKKRLENFKISEKIASDKILKMMDEAGVDEITIIVNLTTRVWCGHHCENHANAAATHVIEVWKSRCHDWLLDGRCHASAEKHCCSYWAHGKDGPGHTNSEILDFIKRGFVKRAKKQ